jgi:hypothetical protein
VKIEHRGPVANWFAVPVSDYVDPEYEAEVQQATQRAEREYRRAQERLKRAEGRLAEAQRKQQAQRLIRELQSLVELRRAELEDCRRLMVATPVVQTDKQIRQRTGLDDHLELGIRKRQRSKRRK